MKTQFTGLLVTVLVATGCAVPVDQPSGPEGASNADR